MEKLQANIGYKVFFTELQIDEVNNKIGTKLKHRIIPNHLESKFLEQYAKKAKDLTITSEEIDSFLEKNK